MKNQFRIQVINANIPMEYFDTLEEAKSELDLYNPNFYEIAELTLDGTYTPVES